jgi:hypothetical protein
VAILDKSTKGGRVISADEAVPVVGVGSDDYRVTREGVVFSFRTRLPKMIGGSRHKYGHTIVTLQTPDGPRQRYVHDMVLETFVGPCPEGMEARHLNGVASDNRVANLEWSTHAVNMRDMLIHGTHPTSLACRRRREATAIAEGGV